MTEAPPRCTDIGHDHWHKTWVDRQGVLTDGLWCKTCDAKWFRCWKPHEYIDVVILRHERKWHK